MKVAFVHLDLGIGGAEQLIVHAARGLKRKGHDVVIYTSFFDPNRCLSGLTNSPKEARDNKDVVLVLVHGDWLPRTIYGVCTLLCSVLRMLWLCFCVPTGIFDVLVNDQVANINPWLRKRTAGKLLFYCHFPDLLLCVERSSYLKRAYRAVFDRWERETTAACDILCVNSEFTKKTLQQTFPAEFAQIETHVLYPPVDLAEVDQHRAAVTTAGVDKANPSPNRLSKHNFFVSLNRYERKKEVELALDAFCILRKKFPKEAEDKVLVVAGGYDVRVPENVEYERELQVRAEELGIQRSVIFLRSVPTDCRWWLLENALALIYTPKNEHFGIVPIEAMALGTFVIASNTGGPRESVADVGGQLVEHHAPGFFEGMRRALFLTGAERVEVGKKTVARVEEKFSLTSFTSKLDELIALETRSSVAKRKKEN
ncbi:unnamed protein product [Amoebophrya sp. A120]|nr:unnamed protein product [Amoebophrya sp. A120]|eukprot:GSA120T00005681001.1